MMDHIGTGWTQITGELLEFSKSSPTDMVGHWTPHTFTLRPHAGLVRLRQLSGAQTSETEQDGQVVVAVTHKVTKVEMLEPPGVKRGFRFPLCVYYERPVVSDAGSTDMIRAVVLLATTSAEGRLKWYNQLMRFQVRGSQPLRRP